MKNIILQFIQILLIVGLLIGYTENIEKNVNLEGDALKI